MVFVWCLIFIFKIGTHPNVCNCYMALSPPWSSAVYFIHWQNVVHKKCQLWFILLTIKYLCI